MNPSTDETVLQEDHYPAGYALGSEPAGKPVPMRADAILERIMDMKNCGWKDANIAVAAGLPHAVVTRWFAGRRAPEATAALCAWLGEVDRQIAEKAGEFVQTKTALKLLSAFDKAREPKDSAGRRGVALSYGASGTGKTTTAEYAARMDENVLYVMVDGECRTWSTLMRAIHKTMQAKGEIQYYRPEGYSLQEWIVKHLPPGSLIIFDHAHHLRRGVIELMLALPLQYGIAVALLCTVEGYERLLDKKMEQVKARVSGGSVFVNLPDAEDVARLMAADGISGGKEQEFCLKIAKRDGGLHYYANMVREARKIAGGGRLDLDTLMRGASRAGVFGGSLAGVAE